MAFASHLGLGDSAQTTPASHTLDELPFAIPTDITYADDAVTKSIVGVTIFKI